ncbi:hypothetical protein CMI42_06280 [Candidatus Pacearchaeota archaeon]|nr:hypothetical protein [Candidatus Pacearchaeota archaeon]|tara:strand:+ start:587 stop:901 length:315 start_codon:yes stop_codon:yes gene_type:complete
MANYKPPYGQPSTSLGVIGRSKSPDELPSNRPSAIKDGYQLTLRVDEEEVIHTDLFRRINDYKVKDLSPKSKRSEEDQRFFDRHIARFMEDGGLIYKIEYTPED